MENGLEKNTDCETCHNEMERPCWVNSHGRSSVKEKRALNQKPWRKLWYTWNYLFKNMYPKKCSIKFACRIKYSTGSFTYMLILYFLKENSKSHRTIIRKICVKVNFILSSMSIYPQSLKTNSLFGTFFNVS